MHSIALLGGTFDPVHNGHINTSIKIQSVFNFDSYYFLPCKDPTIKAKASASAQHRVEMLKIALRDLPVFDIDLREIKRDSPSYMVDTLHSLRAENPESSITLIMGYDAFLGLAHWHDWEHLIKLANLLVINRNKFSGSPIPEPIKKLVQQHKTDNPQALLNQKAGIIYFFDAGNYEISSTNLRTELKHHQKVNQELSEDVYKYIRQQGLYQ